MSGQQCAEEFNALQQPMGVEISFSPVGKPKHIDNAGILDFHTKVSVGEIRSLEFSISKSDMSISKKCCAPNLH